MLSALFYYLTIPLVHAYQKARDAKSKERSERRGKLREALALAAAKLKAISPDAFAAFLKEDNALWGAAIRKAGVKLD